MPRVYAIYAAPCMLPYYGSTKQTLAERRKDHKARYRCWKKGGGQRHCTSFDLFDAVGFDACIFEIVEELPEDCTKEQMLVRERWWFDNHVCVNRNRPICTDEEMAEYHIQYRIEHRDEANEYALQYRINHRAELNEKARQYNAEHRDAILEKKRQYNAEHREELNEKARQYQARKRAEAAKNGCGKP